MGELGELVALEGISEMTVRFEACTQFRGGHDAVLVCSCGWLEDDHITGTEVIADVTPVRRRRPRISVPERRAS